MAEFSNNLINVKIDEKKLKEIEQLLREFPKALPTVMSRALNKTGITARADAARELAKKLRLKVTAIKGALGLVKATKAIWQTTMGIYSNRIKLIEFGARQTKKGVSYQIPYFGVRKRIGNAFIATMKSGHKGVFKRVGKRRKPIVELRGPSLGYVFEHAAGILARSIESAHQNLEKNIDVQVALVLAEFGGKAMGEATKIGGIEDAAGYGLDGPNIVHDFWTDQGVSLEPEVAA